VPPLPPLPGKMTVDDKQAEARAIIEAAIDALVSMGMDREQAPVLLAVQGIIRIGDPMPENEQLAALMNVRRTVDEVIAVLSGEGEAKH
jgi:hypothetical protein